MLAQCLLERQPLPGLGGVLVFEVRSVRGEDDCPPQPAGQGQVGQFAQVPGDRGHQPGQEQALHVPERGRAGRGLGDRAVDQFRAGGPPGVLGRGCQDAVAAALRQQPPGQVTAHRAGRDGPGGAVRRENRQQRRACHHAGKYRS